MKLYFSPGACSLSPHIALCEAGLAVELIKVDLKTKRTETGADYSAINPKGYVPALLLDSGELLTEGPAIVQYIADLKPDAALAPANGTLARYRLQEWLAYINSELHKTIGSLFSPTLTDEVSNATKAAVAKRLDFLSTQLEGKSYLLDSYSVADGYLFTVLNWGQWVGIDIGGWPLLAAYQARIVARPAVQAALKAEGLVGG